MTEECYMRPNSVVLFVVHKSINALKKLNSKNINYRYRQRSLSLSNSSPYSISK